MLYHFHVIGSSESDWSARECASDIGALVHARKLVGSDDSVDVWQGARPVGQMGQAYGHWFLSNLPPLRSGDDERALSS